MANPIGDRVRRLRQERGWSLEELARNARSSKSWLWELETRTSSRPSAEKLGRVADALGVTTGFLVDGENAAVEDPVDEVFFRRYRRLDDDTKEKVRDLVERWSGDGS